MEIKLFDRIKNEDQKQVRACLHLSGKEHCYGLSSRQNQRGPQAGIDRHHSSRQGPRVSSILTIIKVDLSNDMSHCKVYVSSLEGMEKAKEAAKGLNHANGFIKHEVNARIKMRRIPDFHFYSPTTPLNTAPASPKS